MRPPVDKSIVWSDFDRSKLLPRQDVSPDEDDFLTPLVAQASAPASHSGQRLRIKIIQANATTQIEKVVDSFPLMIGREGPGLVIAGDRRISRQHATISLKDGRFFVTDLGGVNGTFLGKNKLPANTPTPLDTNKIVRLSSQTHLEVVPE